jgi:hypothetical protein
MTAGPTPHLFGPPMPDDYVQHRREQIRARVRAQAERSRMRATTGLTSTAAASRNGHKRSTSWWRRLIIG